MSIVPLPTAIYKNYLGMSIALSLIILSVSWVAHAEVIPVCKDGCDYASIQEVIDAAVPGDLIEVQSGTYSENVNVTKQLTLRGVDTGAGTPVVDADHNGCAITLLADGIVLEGIDVRTSFIEGTISDWAGIKVVSNNNTIIGNTVNRNQNGIEVSSTYNMIINNTVKDNANGILLTNSGSNTISGNIVTYNEYGIRLKSSSDNFVADNNLSGNIYGLLLNSSDDNTISGNNANDNDYGVLLDSSVGNNLTDNWMYENSYNFGADGNNDIDVSNRVDDGKRIYYIVGSPGEVVKSDAGAVYCINCDNMSISGLFLTNGINGVYFYNTTNSTVENNNFVDNLCGIKLVDSSNNTIKSNDAIGGHSGICLLESEYNNVTLNNLSESTFGVDLWDSHMNGVVNNSIVSNENGIRLRYCGGNDVSRNNISCNSIGICYDVYVYNYNILDDNQMFYNEEDSHLLGDVAHPPSAIKNSETSAINFIEFFKSFIRIGRS